MSPTLEATPQTPTTTPEWPPAGKLKKKDAATKLGLSVERIAGLVREGTLKSTKARDPEINQVVTLIDEEDVKRILAERANPEQGVKFVDKPDKPDKPVTVPQPQADVSLTNALVQRLLNPPPAAALPPAPRPWLTIAEAAEYSGLTRRWLESEARAAILGEETPYQFAIKVRDMGRGTRGGRWRFLRADLEKG